MAAVRGRPSGLPGFGGFIRFSSLRTAATLSSGSENGGSNKYANE
jgi:hypothetical protein